MNTGLVITEILLKSENKDNNTLVQIFI